MSRQTLVEEKEELVRAFQMTKDVIEEDADREIEDLKSRYVVYTLDLLVYKKEGGL